MSDQIAIGGKYPFLGDNSCHTTKWAPLKPQAPFYWFYPADQSLVAEYSRGVSLPDAMRLNVLGFQTHRDEFAIAFERSEIERRMSALLDGNVSDTEIKSRFDLTDTRDWTIRKARKRIAEMDDWRSSISLCAYRPFDDRWCHHSYATMDFPRRELIDHVLNRRNIALASSRQQGAPGFRHCWVTRLPVNDCLVSNRSREANQVFPLYLYPTENESGPLLAKKSGSDIRPGVNCSPSLVRLIHDRTSMNPIDFGQGDLIEKFGPEDVLAYVYAVLNSPSYRDRYESFLEKDFARIQVTRSAHLFRALCKLGHQLIRLHVMESTGPNRPAFPVAGENEVAKPRWTPPEGKTPGRVWINRTQYFEGVPRAVWEFRVGGYQVCEKWLKDRKGRTLSHDELEHYRRVAAALARTIELMAEIDQAIEAHGGWPIDKGDGPAQPPLPRGSAAPPAAEAPAPTEKPRRPAPESTPSKAAPRRAR